MGTRRSTRKRVVVELDTKAEDEADVDFWGQDAFAEEDEDDEFDDKALSDTGEDVVDSDFDMPEGNDDDDDEQVAEREVRARERALKRKSRSAYVEPTTAPVRRKQRTGQTTSLSAPATVVATGGVRERTSLRNSTKRASAEAAASRAKRAQLEEKRRQRRAERDARRPRVRVPTQEELMLEAKETEVKNRESLNDLLRLEEERKRVPIRKKEAATHVVSVRDRDGRSTVSITDKEADARQVLFPQLFH